MALATLAAACASVLLYAPTFGDPAWHYNPGGAGASRLVRDVWTQWLERVPLAGRVALIAGFLAGALVHRRLAYGRVSLVVPAVATLGLVALSGRVPPFARTFLFLLPLFLIVSAAGLVWLGELVARWSPRAVVLVAATIIVSLVVLPMAAVIRHGPGYDEDPPWGSDAAMRALKTRAQPGDLVLTDIFTITPTQYYFRRYGINAGPVTTLPPSGKPAGRMYLLWSPNIDKSPAQVFDSAGFPHAPVRLLHVVGRYKWVTLYDASAVLASRSP